MNKIPKKSYLDEVLVEVDGALIGRVRPPSHFSSLRAMRIWNAKFSGKRLGRMMTNGSYRQVMIDGKRYLEHRVVAVLHGIDIDGMVVDHIDGNGLNNQIENLRACRHTENMRNNAGWARKASRVGISKRKSGKWAAYIRSSGRQVNLGTFDDAEAASSARRKAEKLHYGEFAISDDRLTDDADSEHGVVWHEQRRAA